MIASERGCIEIIQYLIETLGAEANLTNKVRTLSFVNVLDSCHIVTLTHWKQFGRTAFLSACEMHNTIEVIKYLVTKGANVHVTNDVNS